MTSAIDSKSKRFRPAHDAALALADGRVFRGRGFGADTDAAGEVVFTTTMTGYQEVCTDPSFKGQLVCMTYPLIGNYGVAADDDESRQPWISALIVREHCDHPSNWRSTGTIDDYLKQHGIPGISGIDTRALTRHIRSVGDMRAVLVRNAANLTDEELVDAGQASAAARRATGRRRGLERSRHQPRDRNDGPHVVVLDCGVKRNIVRSLLNRGARVTSVPYGTPFADIAALHPDGVIVSPGPGDPANLDDGLDVVRVTPRPEAALLRHLPWTSVAGARDRRRHGQAQIRTSRRQSSGPGHAQRSRLDHGPEPWLRRQDRLLAQRIRAGMWRWSI